MARSRFGGLVVLSLFFVLVTAQSGRSDEANSKKPLARPPAPPPNPFTFFDSSIRKTENVTKPARGTEDDFTCKVYPLAELSPDPNLGKWIAETIPWVIQPRSWNTQGGDNALSYYGPACILVVNAPSATHTQVDAFLKNLKRSLPQAKEASARSVAKPSVLVPAKYSPSEMIRNPDTTPSKSTAYPVPAQAKQPKHLFHFIIRYEGDGVIDSNVAGVLKQLYGTEEQSEDPKPGKKKKKKSAEPAAGQTSAPVLDQLFHLIVRYEGDGIIDSTVADVLKTIYAGENWGTRYCVPPSATPVPVPQAPPIQGPATSTPAPATSPTPLVRPVTEQNQPEIKKKKRKKVEKNQSPTSSY